MAFYSRVDFTAIANHLNAKLMKDILKQLNPTGRFSGRVDNYAKYRPSYPAAVLDVLEKEIGLQKSWNVADVGSGTGIFSSLLLQYGCAVWGVEPNTEMREEGERQLKDYTKFTSVAGSAEHTVLANDSVDLVTVAQAFHWMEPVATKQEFDRILKKNGHIALIWNLRTTGTPFLQKFEQLKVDFGTDYKATRMVKEPEIEAFFQPASTKIVIVHHHQLLDYEGLEGQLLSTSYVPLEGEKHNTMLDALRDLFEQYNENGLVSIEYDTKMYLREH